ncbi:MAG: hypothetical protein GQ477_00725 [Nanohaloarchaea archaeon]|nr:hypothetical protein [Candidatus Nanohaloarchaea archaeon]
MDETQIKIMLRIAREAGNFSELKRLEKIMRFHDPGFSYAKLRQQKKYLNQSIFEKVKSTNNGKYISA